METVTPTDGAPGADGGATGAGNTGDHGGTLLTKPDAAPAPGGDGGQPPAAGTTPEPGKEGAADGGNTPPDPLALVPENGEGYSLGFKEGTEVDVELEKGFRAAAHEMGLNQGQAAKLAGLYEVHAKQTAEAQAVAMQKTVQGWEAEITASPTFEADKGHAQRALQQFGSPELTDLLNESFLGSHPQVFRLMTNVGKALAEPELKGKGGAPGDGAMSTEAYLKQQLNYKG